MYQTWKNRRASLFGLLLLLGLVCWLVTADKQGEIKAEASVAAGEAQLAAEKESAEAIFEQRLLPIFNSPQPSSCTQCHLAGVDLKNYILPSHEKTFLSLRDHGLIDVDKPEESRILRMISMGEKEKVATLIQENVRRREYDAFAEWIKASSADRKLRNAPPLHAAEVALLKDPAAEEKNLTQVEKVFGKTVWAERNRCANCHVANGKNTAKLVKENGERMVWIKDSPKETMDYLIEAKLVDAARPERSLLLLKPLNQVKHGGGQKMKVGDDCYRSFVTWLKEYSASRRAEAKPEPKGSDKKPETPPAAARKSIELSVTGLMTFDDNRKLRIALNAVQGVKRLVIDRKPTGASKVQVFYDAGEEPDLKALLEAVTKSGYKAAKVDP